MNTYPFRLVISFATTIFILQTIVYGQNRRHQSNEALQMKVKTQKDVINYSILKQQPMYSFNSRMNGTRDAVIMPFLISKGVEGIQKFIDNRKKKYNAQYNFAQTDLNFYDQLSTESSLDPTGLQFKGFTLTRTFINKHGQEDTAFIVNFGLDTSKAYEIINSSTFRLVLTDIEIRKPKVKMPNKVRTVNMDFEITFTTSYINDAGQMFTDVPLGKFIYALRNAPIDKSADGYKAYYDSLKGTPLIGKSFIVPRSRGYYYAENNTIEKSFSAGAYSVQVSVKETSKNTFVDKLIIDNGRPFTAVGQKELLQAVNAPLVSTVTPPPAPVSTQKQN
jgi:hypothetical protein